MGIIVLIFSFSVVMTIDHCSSNVFALSHHGYDCKYIYYNNNNTGDNSYDDINLYVSLMYT